MTAHTQISKYSLLLACSNMLTIFENRRPGKTILNIEHKLSAGQKQIFRRDDAGCGYRNRETEQREILQWMKDLRFVFAKNCKLESAECWSLKSYFKKMLSLPPFSVYTTAMWRCSSDATLFIFAKMNFIKFYSWNFQGNVSTLLICEIGSLLSWEFLCTK